MTPAEYFQMTCDRIRDIVDDVLAWQDLQDPEGVIQVAGYSRIVLADIGRRAKSQRIASRLDSADREIASAVSRAKKAMRKDRSDGYVRKANTPIREAQQSVLGGSALRKASGRSRSSRNQSWAA